MIHDVCQHDASPLVSSAAHRKGPAAQHCESHTTRADRLLIRSPRRTARFEDTQVSGIVGHDAAADTSLAPLGRARILTVGSGSGVGSCYEDSSGGNCCIGEPVGDAA